MATRLRALERQALDAFNQNSLQDSQMPVAAQQMVRDQLAAKTRLARLENEVIQSKSDRAMQSLDVQRQVSRDDASNKMSLVQYQNDLANQDRNNWLAVTARGLAAASGLSGAVSNIASGLAARDADGNIITTESVSKAPSVDAQEGLGYISDAGASPKSAMSEAGGFIKPTTVQADKPTGEFRRQYNDGIKGSIGKAADWLARGMDKVLPGNLSSDQASVRDLHNIAVSAANQKIAHETIMTAYRETMEIMQEHRAQLAMEGQVLGYSEDDLEARMQVFSILKMAERLGVPWRTLLDGGTKKKGS